MNQDEVEKLAEKWRYNPARRYETVAGVESITDKQLSYIKLLAIKRPEESAEIERLLNAIWETSCPEEWSKAEGMFAITALKSIKDPYVLDVDKFIVLLLESLNAIDSSVMEVAVMGTSFNDAVSRVGSMASICAIQSLSKPNEGSAQPAIPATAASEET